MKVRCIDTSGGAVNHLKYGAVYTVQSHVNNVYYLDGVCGGWFNYRFEAVEDQKSPPQSAAKGSINPLIAGALHDIDEDKCWELLKPRVEEGHCKCGIAKVRCDFHREDTPIPPYQHIKV